MQPGVGYVAFMRTLAASPAQAKGIGRRIARAPSAVLVPTGLDVLRWQAGLARHERRARPVSAG